MADTWMKRNVFASHVGVGARTVDRWISAGMPTAKVGRIRLINVEMADEWLKNHMDDSKAKHAESIVNELLKKIN